MRIVCNDPWQDADLVLLANRAAAVEKFHAFRQ